MTKLLTPILILQALLGLVLASCGGGGEEGVAPQPPTPPAVNDKLTLVGECTSGLVFTSEGGTKEITFTTDGGDWTAALTGNTIDWCSITPKSGSGTAGTVKVTVKASDSYDERSAVVQLTRGTVKRTVKITQKQKDALLVSSDNVEVEKDGGDFTVTVKSNIDYKYSIPVQFSSWLKEAPSSRALTERTIAFTAEKNFDYEGREGYIVFSGGGKEEAVYVNQAGGSRLLLSQTEQNISASGGTLSVELSSNCDFTVSTPTVDWVHKVDSRAMSSHTVYFQIDEYTSIEQPRQTEVTFTSADGGISETLTIIQHEKGEIILGDKEVEAKPGATSMSIEIESNIDVSYQISSGDESWIRVTLDSRSRAMQMHTMYVELAPNLTGASRQGTITIFDNNNPDYRQVVTVNQVAATFTLKSSSLKPGDFQDADRHDIMFEFETNLDTVALILPEHTVFRFEKNMFTMTNISGAGEVMYAGTAKVTLLANIRTYSATDYIRFRPVAGWVQENMPDFAKIEIHQDRPELSAIRDSITVSSFGTTLANLFSSNLSYTVSVDGNNSSWVKLSGYDASKRSYTATVSPNTTTQQRKAVLTAVATGNPDLKATYTIIQKAGVDTYEPLSYTLTETVRLSDQISEDEIASAKALAISGVLKTEDYEIIVKMVKQHSLRSLDLSKARITPDTGINPYKFRLEGVDDYFRFLDGEETTIPGGLFKAMPLSSLKIPDNIEILEDNILLGSSVKEFVLPASVSNIKSSAFADWRSGIRIDMSAATKVKKINKRTFDNDLNLEEVILPPNLEDIGESAFALNSLITLYTEPEGKLRTIKFPSTLKTIGQWAFIWQTGLEEVEIPAGVISIGKEAFEYNKSLRSAIVNCVTFDKILPQGLFYECESLEHVVIAEGYTEIGPEAFRGTGRIKSLVIPAGVTVIGNSAFSNSEIESITLPEGLTRIGKSAFWYCVNLETMTIPSTVTTIGDGALTGCCSNSIHLRMKTPPTIEGEISHLGDQYLRQITLYVPNGCKEAYQAIEPWNLFKEIIEE